MALPRAAVAQTPASDSTAADTTQQYIKLESGERIKGSLVLKEPLIGRSYFLINDSMRVERRNVRAYYDGSDYFRRAEDGLWVQRVRDEKHLGLWTTSVTVPPHFGQPGTLPGAHRDRMHNPHAGMLFMRSQEKAGLFLDR